MARNPRNCLLGRHLQLARVIAIVVVATYLPGCASTFFKKEPEPYRAMKQWPAYTGYIAMGPVFLADVTAGFGIYFTLGALEGFFEFFGSEEALTFAVTTVAVAAAAQQQRNQAAINAEILRQQIANQQRRRKPKRSARRPSVSASRRTLAPSPPATKSVRNA